MVDAIVTVVVTLVTTPKPVEELQGLVYGMANDADGRAASTSWWESPKLLGFTALGIGADPDHHLLVGARAMPDDD